MAISDDNGLNRRATVAALLAERGDMLVVTGLGSPTWDVAAAGDDDRNFYLWGAMGGAAMVGMGLALAQPDRPVAVITGDGEQLMGIGALATIGAHRPPNLTIVVLDNRHYGETGMQPSHTGLGTDLCAVARGCGIDWVAEAAGTSDASGMAGVEDIRRRIHRCDGSGFALIAIATGEDERVLPERDGATIKTRFRRALGLPGG